MAACLGLPISQSADHWGRKWFVVILSGLSTVGCIVVATAESMAVAIAGQCIVGFSYAVQALEHSIASEILPRKYRPYAQASISAATSLGGVAGLLIGGALTRNNPSGFRTYWYITAGLYAATTLTIAWLYNPPLRELQHKLTTFEKLARLDWIGYCFVICGLVLFSFALTSSTGIYPWRSAEILVPLVLGSAFLLAFGIYEWRFTSTGMLHHDLFSRSRNFALAELCIFLEGICFFASNNYFGYEVSVLYDQDQFHAGLWYTVAWWSCLVSAWVAGLYCSKTKTVRLTVVLAMAAWTLFNALMATLTPSTRSHILGYAPFMGIGFGAALNILVVVAQLSTPPELISITTGLLLATRGFGGTVGLSIYTAIFTGTLSHELPGKVGRATVAQGLDPSYVDQLVAYVATSDWASVGNMPNMTESISQAALLASKESYALAFRYVWICAAVFCAFGILGRWRRRSYFMKKPRLIYTMCSSGRFLDRSKG